MVVKLFEIRDAGTMIPAMATMLIARSDAEQWLLRRGGFAEGMVQHEESPLGCYIILWPLTGGHATWDPYGPSRARTYQVAHNYILKHWRELTSGDVIDVEFLLGERAEPKVSERLTVGG
jgi:hypothetical protein